MIEINYIHLSCCIIQRYDNRNENTITKKRYTLKTTTMSAADNLHSEQILKKLTPKERLVFYELRDAKTWQKWNESQRNRKLEQFTDSFFKLNCREVKVLLYQVLRSINTNITLIERIYSDQKSVAEPKKNIIEIKVNGVSAFQIITPQN